MTADIHTCSYYCERPGCIRAQRDELVAKVEALRAEVERLRADRDSWEQQASDRVADWHAEHLRAERLVEASRQLVSMYERATGLPCPPQLRRALAQQPAAVDAALAQRIQALVGGVEVDLEAPLSAGANATTQTHGAMLRQLEPQLQEQLAESERAAAAQAAEIEALRAEVERSERYAEQSERERLWAESRAERLAEALEEIRSRSSMNLAMRPDPSALTARLGGIYQIADAALGKESKR